MDSQQSLRVVVVEDNRELREILGAGLRHFGHQVIEVCDGEELDEILTEFAADIVILDLGLPGEDGISIANRLRCRSKTIGIVMVTARGRVDDRVAGLDIGADLYFVKPVDIRELESSLRSLHRRIASIPSNSWHFNSKTSILTAPKGAQFLLSAKECIVLMKLLEAPGENVPRKAIFAALNIPDDLYSDRRLETMISRLRVRIQSSDPTIKLPIRARHNLGYAFLADVEVENRAG